MSNDGANNDRSVRIPTFHEGKWQVFSVKFKAMAAIKGFAEALEPGFKSKLPASEDTSLDLAKEDEKAQSKAKEKNALAVHYLTMSFENEEQLGYIEDARSDEWPSALACEIWASLVDENKPSDTIAVAEMLKKMMNLKLSSGEDPKKLGERIAMVQAGYTCKVDENQKIATVVSAGGKAYANTIQQETMLCEFKNEKMTAKRLIKAMQQNFRLKGGEESDDEVSVLETALALGNFPGKCYNCGKPGHKRPDCPEMQKPFSGMGRYQGKCHECGGIGHKQSDCWEKEENESKRPRNWVSKKGRETGLGTYEILVANVENEKEFEKDCTVVATLENEKCMEDDCTVVAALMANESVLGLEYDCTVVATLNLLNEDTLKLGLEKDSTLEATLIPVNEDMLKLGLEDVSTLEATLNPTNENRLKLKQDDFEQGRVLERVAQIPLVVAGTYDTYDSVSHGTNENYDARSHDRNSASANNSSDGGFRARI